MFYFRGHFEAILGSKKNKEIITLRTSYSMELKLFSQNLQSFRIMNSYEAVYTTSQTSAMKMFEKKTFIRS